MTLVLDEDVESELFIIRYVEWNVCTGVDDSLPWAQE
jgi:hypothetical protein